MKKNALEFWVGLFVLLGAAAIGFLAFRAAGGQSFGKSSQPTPSMPISATSAA
ncbi:hypothetical protein L7A47_36140 [Achromobacter xylosoxidans]|uniref:hypothetical protein n=1 Tax=Alcaligenes xylosoxydans xylosoxydans TaxID=85698 RepID=UPI001F0E49FF|nr:hypothetical protein [Achromobacter xylosoxidans]MCH4597728.1 hypothetical protein [Achromobacter xylosoxidans]